VSKFGYESEDEIEYHEPADADEIIARRNAILTDRGLDIPPDDYLDAFRD